jgi:serine/threonine protein kinase
MSDREAPETPPTREVGATVLASEGAADDSDILGKRRSEKSFDRLKDEPESEDVHVGEEEPVFDGARYEDGALLGSGGMGAVYLSRDRRIGRQVATKTLHAHLPSRDARLRFLREARIQGQLEHPAIPPVYDLGKDDRGVWFTMKRLRGQTLSRVLHHQSNGDAEVLARFPVRRLLQSFLTVCDALHYAHTRGVVHRDLKPANIMLGEFGEVWVVDWGLAGLIEDAPPSEDRRSRVNPDHSRQIGGNITRPGNVVGTIQYMSPEQVRGERADERADVYTLGVILYEMLTKKRFREQGDYIRVLAAIADGHVARPSSVVKDIDLELDAICVKATAIDKADRYRTAKDLRDAIERYLAGVHDLEVRHQAAAKIVKTARDRLSHAEIEKSPASLAGARAEAMHEVLRALSVDPASEETRRFLVELVQRVDGEPPPEALKEVEANRAAMRHEGTVTAVWGFLSWLLVVPLVILAGVRDWTWFGIALGSTLGALGWALYRRSAGSTRTIDGVVLGIFLVGILASVGSYLGPFVVVPTCATAAAMFYAMHAEKKDRPTFLGILLFGALLPFALEYFGAFGPRVSIAADGLTIPPRLVGYPPVVTWAGLAWVSASFVVFSALLVSRLRDRLDLAEERLRVSAWHLKQLFPEKQ